MDTLRTALSTYDELVASNESIRRKYISLKAKWQASRGEELKEEVESLTSEVTHLEKALETTETERDLLRAEVNDLKQDKLEISDELTYMTRYREEAELALTTVETERDRLLCDEEFLTEELKVLTEQKNEAENEVALLETERDGLLDDNKSLAAELAYVTEQKESAERERDNWRVAYETTEAKRKRLRKKVKQSKKVE